MCGNFVEEIILPDSLQVIGSCAFYNCRRLRRLSVGAGDLTVGSEDVYKRQHKNWLGEVTNPRQIKGGLKEALEGADVFIGVSRPGILTTRCV